MRQHIYRKTLIMIGIAACLLSTAGLAGESKQVTMTLQIKVTPPPPCTLSETTVEFGQVLTTKVDGQNYLMPVGYTMNCDGRTKDTLKIQLQGDATTINGETVLSTNVSGLGIRVRRTDDHSLVVPGTSQWINFTYAGNTGPALEAVPVKANGTTLSPGEFSAVGTLVVEYQ